MGFFFYLEFWWPHGHTFTWQGCFWTKRCPLLSLPSLPVLLPARIFKLSFFVPINFSGHICSFLAWTVLSVFTSFSLTFHFLTSLLFATSSLQFIRDLAHSLCATTHVVGGWDPGDWGYCWAAALSANTSLWPRLYLDGRSWRPGLINGLVSPLLWGCFTRVNWGFYNSWVFFIHSPDVTLLDVLWEIDTPCWAGWRVGKGSNEMISNLAMDPKQTTKWRMTQPWTRTWDIDIHTHTLNWPHFLLMELGDEALLVAKLSPFNIKASKPWS